MDVVIIQAAPGNDFSYYICSMITFTAFNSYTAYNTSLLSWIFKQINITTTMFAISVFFIKAQSRMFPS
jgi:hypothetical protein